MASNAQGEGACGSSSLKRERKSGGKLKEPRVRQRGLGIAELENLRIRKEMAATARSVVPNNLHAVSVYQLQDNMRVQNPYFLQSVPSSFQYSLVTAPPVAGPQAAMMSLGSKGCDLKLPSVLDKEEHDDLNFGRPNYFTNLLLAEDSEEETEQLNKKAQTDSLGGKSCGRTK